LIEHQYGDVCYLQFDHLRQFSALTHGIFTRTGGYSETPYQSLNTSRLKDSVDNVVRNRQLALEALAIPTIPCVTLWQVHSAEVVTFSRQDEWRTDWAQLSYFQPGWTQPSIHKGDALITQERAAALALSFADCVPIVFYAPDKQVIGIAHGGWRGTARGIVVATIRAMSERFDCQPEHIYAGIGPAIGPCCYEVDEGVREIFQGQAAFEDLPTHEEYRGIVRESAVFSTQQLAERSSLRLDLQQTNRNQLLMAGVRAEQIEVMEICTSCNSERFFSHRAEHGQTGRFAVIMALEP